MHPKLNYTEAADRYIQQMLLMKDEVKIRETADKMLRRSLEEKLMVEGYRRMARKLQAEREKNIGVEQAAIQLLEQLIQEPGESKQTNQALTINPSNEELQRLRSRALELVDKRAREKFERAFNKEIDHKFQKACVTEVESMTESFGPETHDEATKSKIKHIKDMCLLSAHAALCRAWTVECDKCKSKHTYRLNKDQVNALVRDGYLQLNTKESLIVTISDLANHAELGKHEHRITLASIVRKYLESS